MRKTPAELRILILRQNKYGFGGTHTPDDATGIKNDLLAIAFDRPVFCTPSRTG